MARRRGLRTPPQTFAGTETAINNMERAVIYRSVDITFTPNDVLDCLFPKHALEALRTAYPYAQTAGYGVGTEQIEFAGSDIIFRMEYDKLRCVRPSLSAGLQPDAPKLVPVMEALRQILAITDEFMVVRAVVEWFNENLVTPGCARYYFPALGNLLPSTHAIHSADGSRFKPTVLDEHITRLLRKAPEVITKGLLADPEHNSTKDSSVIQVQIGEGQRVAFV